MLATLLGTMIIFGAVVCAMAIGAIVQGKRLKGSCGGTGKACDCSALKARKCELREMRESSSS